MPVNAPLLIRHFGECPISLICIKSVVFLARMESRPLKLYLGSVPGSLTSDSLTEALRPQVVSFLQVETVKRIGKDKVIKNKGFAFLTLWDPEEYRQLVSNEKVLTVAGRTLKVTEYKATSDAQVDRFSAQLRRVFIKSIPLWANDQNLRTAFLAAGLKPEVIFRARKYSTHENFQFGFAEFSDPMSAQLALKIGKICIAQDKSYQMTLHRFVQKDAEDMIQNEENPTKKVSKSKPHSKSTPTGVGMLHNPSAFDEKRPETAYFTDKLSSMVSGTEEPPKYSSLLNYGASPQYGMSHEDPQSLKDFTSSCPETTQYSVRPPLQSRKRRKEYLGQSPEGILQYASNLGDVGVRGERKVGQDLRQGPGSRINDPQMIHDQGAESRELLQPGLANPWWRFLGTRSATLQGQNRCDRVTEALKLTQPWQESIKMAGTAREHRDIQNLRFNVS